MQGSYEETWRSLVLPLFVSVTLAAGASSTTDPIIIADGGYESLHTIITGTGTLTMSYTCDNSNSENFTVPYVDGVNVGELVSSRAASNRVDGISMIPSARKKFTITNSGASDITVGVYLNIVLK